MWWRHYATCTEEWNRDFVIGLRWVCVRDWRCIWHISLVGLSILIIQIRPIRTFSLHCVLWGCVVCVLFYFLCFIMNLFVTRRSQSSVEKCCRQPMVFVRASMLRHPRPHSFRSETCWSWIVNVEVTGLVHWHFWDSIRPVRNALLNHHQLILAAWIWWPWIQLPHIHR